MLIPRWPLLIAQHAGRFDDAGPAAVWRDGLIVAVNENAAAEGVMVGQKKREAEALCPVLALAESDPGAEATAFEPIAAVLEQLIPRVEVAEPGLAYVSAAGALRYFGGAEATARRVLAAVRAAGAPTARVGLARGPFAARAAAERTSDHDPVLVLEPAAEAEFLRALPLAALDDPDLIGALRRLGLRTLGDVATLPRGAMAARFGAVGLHAHRLAHGEDRLPAPRPPREDLAVDVELDEPLTDLDTTAFVARSLASRLITGLEGQGLSAFAIEVASGDLRRTWRSLDPLDERALTDRARWQVSAWAAAGLLPDGLTRLRLTPLDVTATGRQLSLLADAAADEEAARAYTRVQALLGPDAVRRAVLQGGRGPGDRHRFVRHSEPDPGAPPERAPDAPWPGRLPDPSPALVLTAPASVDVHISDGVPRTIDGEDIIDHTGPWRLREVWWDGERRRDLEWWQVVTTSGARLLARSLDGWAVHAVYD